MPNPHARYVLTWTSLSGPFLVPVEGKWETNSLEEAQLIYTTHLGDPGLLWIDRELDLRLPYDDVPKKYRTDSAQGDLAHADPYKGLQDILQEKK